MMDKFWKNLRGVEETAMSCPVASDSAAAPLTTTGQQPAENTEAGDEPDGGDSL